MPEFKPLNFFRYNWSHSRIKPDQVISPPYDVLSPDDKNKLAGEPFNVVHVDSPSSYQAAAHTLTDWVKNKILIPDQHESFYVMATDYQAGNSSRTRWGVFGGLRLHPFEDRVVFPHEQTYSKAKDDRLNLMKTTQAQLSPIFAVYDDPALVLEDIGQACLNQEPMITFNQEHGVKNRLWRVPDQHNQSIQNLVLSKKVFIADGHHRYETALNYQQSMGREANAPWNHVFIYLSNISSPGLEIFPYHRIVSRNRSFEWEKIKNQAKSIFTTSPVSGPESLSALTRPEAFVLYENRKFTLFTPLEESADIFSRIGAHVLDKLFLRQAMRLSDKDLSSGEFLSYTHDQNQCIELVNSGQAQAAFLLKPVPMDILGQVCETGQVMPRKSTYFFPKLPTGVLFHLW
ncbi:DUF1015 domain-containing protein [Desulfonatronovibrio hydrogenovorans]|uniref:DUF1015 domain-containing protein n=1 Tax=Desulfonatronovibrio hydrogenovorans TaxID=53245 RepID=UPI00048ADF5B|nr:DUF1015 domain-containing protein [Desulfonatronovibrio hydrogenovorans]